MNTRHSARTQHGMAALLVTLFLFVVMVLAAVFVNRNLLLEQRSANNQYRATQAFEAAEAGVEWALAQLNNPQRLGSDCTAAPASTATAFRERYLRFDRRTGRIAPRALRPACVRGVNGWVCSCPIDGAPSLPAIGGSGSTPAFLLEFIATDRPGVVRIVSTGCTHPAGACAADASGSAEATARIEVSAALIPALRVPPAAALTARGAIQVGGSALGAHNPDPDSGIAIHAGATIVAPAAQLTTPAGAGNANALVANDAALATISPAHFFASHFGIGKPHWRDQPGATRIACGTDCAGAVLRAIDAAGSTPMLWIDGDLALDGDTAIGSLERPVLIVTTGALRLSGALRVHGVLYGADVSWARTPASGALLRGALLSETGYAGDGTPALHYDTQVLTTLQRASGTFVRVSGSWRDF